MTANNSSTLRSFLLGLVFVVGGLLLGLAVGDIQPAQASGNCGPGYPVCWFSAECSGQCWGYECESLTCDARSSPYNQCYVCVEQE